MVNSIANVDSWLFTGDQPACSYGLIMQVMIIISRLLILNSAWHTNNDNNHQVLNCWQQTSRSAGRWSYPRFQHKCYEKHLKAGLPTVRAVFSLHKKLGKSINESPTFSSFWTISTWKPPFWGAHRGYGCRRLFDLRVLRSWPRVCREQIPWGVDASRMIQAANDWFIATLSWSNQQAAYTDPASCLQWWRTHGERN